MSKCKYFLKIFKNRKKWFIKDLIIIVVESNQIFSKKKKMLLMNFLNQRPYPVTMIEKAMKESGTTRIKIKYVTFLYVSTFCFIFIKNIS